MSTLPPIQRKRPADEPPKKKLTATQLKELGKRLCTDSLKHKEEVLHSIEQTTYPTENSRLLTVQSIRQSADRQVNEEMKRRQVKHEELQQKYEAARAVKTVKLNSQEIEENIRRVYDEAVRVKKEKLKRLEEAQEARLNGTKKERHVLSLPQIQECGKRLCVPIKRAWTEEEINAILFPSLFPKTKTRVAVTAAT